PPAGRADRPERARRAVIRPTATGLKAALFLAAVTIAYFVSPYTDLFFLLLAFLCCTLAFGMIGCCTALSGASASVEPLRPMPAGAPAPLAVRVSAGRRSRFALEVAVRLAGMPRAQVVARAPMAAPGEQLLTGAIGPLPRGVHRIAAATLRSRWPCRLLEARRPVTVQPALVAHPAPLGAAARGAWDAGADGRSRPRSGLEPASLREFAPGDPTSRIHWRASARRSTPVVKVFEDAARRGTEVRFDRRCAPEPFEDALGVLAALALR